MRNRNGQYTNAQKLRRALWAKHDRAFDMWYVEAARPTRTAFTANGAEMLARLKPVQWAKTAPEAMGRVRGLTAGNVALWAGVDLRSAEDAYLG